MDLVPDELLHTCFTAIDCARSFAAAGQVCTRWRTVSKSCRSWDAHMMLCKLEWRIVKPVLVETKNFLTPGKADSLAVAAVAHPAGLLYTAHEEWTTTHNGGVLTTDRCKIVLRVWDLRPHVPALLHSFCPTDYSCSEPALHVGGGFIGVTLGTGGRPQVRHALRPPKALGTVLQSKLSGGFGAGNANNGPSAIHIRAHTRDAFVGYPSGKVAHHDLESGVCVGELGGACRFVAAIASHGEQVFVCGRKMFGEVPQESRACVIMLTTSADDLLGRRLRPWGVFMQPPDHEASKLLGTASDGPSPSKQANGTLARPQTLVMNHAPPLSPPAGWRTSCRSAACRRDALARRRQRHHPNLGAPRLAARHAAHS